MKLINDWRNRSERSTTTYRLGFYVKLPTRLVKTPIDSNVGNHSNWLIYITIRKHLISASILPPPNEVCEGNVFTGVCLSIGGISVWWGVSLLGFSVWGVSVKGSLSWGSLSRRGLCRGGGVCPGALCPGGFCPGGLCRGGGGFCLGSPSGRPPYGNVRVVRILLECILVTSTIFFSAITSASKVLNIFTIPMLSKTEDIKEWRISLWCLVSKIRV